MKEDFAQCVLFDGSGRTARLNGISYIVSEKLFDTPPAAERAYAEMLSGQLVAPSIPAIAEQELMRGKMNSYGKTWHAPAPPTGRPMPCRWGHRSWPGRSTATAKRGRASSRRQCRGGSKPGGTREQRGMAR